MTFKIVVKEPVRVSDHAVLRYMERVMGLDVEKVRAHIHDVCSPAASIGAVCVRAEGHRFEIVNNAVLTVTPDRLGPSKTTQARNQRIIERNTA